MQTPVIVDLKVFSQRGLGFVKAPVILEVDFLVFHGPPQPFSEDVVKASAPAVHADLNVRVFPQLADILKAGKLAALVTVMDFGQGDCQSLS